MNRIIVFFLILLGLSTPSIACRCLYPGDFKVEEVEKYDYVGLVRIKSLLPPDIEITKENRSNIHHWAEVEELIGYKGILPGRLKIYGGNKKFNFHTSCDLGIDEGEEWVIFAKFSGDSLLVSPCKRTTRFRDVDGKIEKDPYKIFKKLKRYSPKIPSV